MKSMMSIFFFSFLMKKTIQDSNDTLQNLRKFENISSFSEVSAQQIQPKAQNDTDFDNYGIQKTEPAKMNSAAQNYENEISSEDTSNPGIIKYKKSISLDKPRTLTIPIGFANIQLELRIGLHFSNEDQKAYIIFKGKLSLNIPDSKTLSLNLVKILQTVKELFDFHMEPSKEVAATSAFYQFRITDQVYISFSINKFDLNQKIITAEGFLNFFLITPALPLTFSKHLGDLTFNRELLDLSIYTDYKDAQAEGRLPEKISYDEKLDLDLLKKFSPKKLNQKETKEKEIPVNKDEELGNEKAKDEGKNTKNDKKSSLKIIIIFIIILVGTWGVYIFLFDKKGQTFNSEVPKAIKVERFY